MPPTNSEQILEEARELLLAGDYGRALALYEKLTRICPGVARVCYEFGNAASKMHQMELADRTWRKAIELEPRNAEFVGMIGHQYQAQRQTERKREAIPPLAFLGGHPRSGTTLLEQILDAHPGVAALDEPAAFLDVLQPEFHKSLQLSSPRVNQLRRHYIQALQQEIGPAGAGKMLVDKNPSPTSRLPVWLRVFPELKVLIALRDPRDVVLSCFFQNIPLNSANVNFLSFDRLAKHYADLMGIWLLVREWDGFAWLETKYEDTVADIGKEGRRVTEFLGLQWHEEQARFYEKSGKKQLFSPTYQDVTRPVYKRSVARWHAYEKYLAPILPALEPFCRKFGYG